MFQLRPYECGDAADILSWVSGEEAFYKWSAGRLGPWPVTSEAFVEYYRANPEIMPMTMADEQGAAGHLLLRWPTESRTTLRLGFIIVDGKRRGQGLGRTLLRLALYHAFETLGAERVTLGVFDNNPPARRCYESLGFRHNAAADETYHLPGGFCWPCSDMMLEKADFRKALE